MSRENIYSEIVRRISYSKRRLEELEKCKSSLKEAIDAQFSNVDSYHGLKFIGSAETGLCLKLKKDIDGVILLAPFEKDVFREKVGGLNSPLENINFTERCRFVRDHFTGNYLGYDLAIGGVDAKSSPSTSIEGDLMFHPDFTKKYLGPQQKEDVLLTKMFFKNAGVYGRDVGGGFPLEQLVAYYGDFDSVVEAFSKGENISIDYSGKNNGFEGPLVITYPFCGLQNMSAGVNEKQFKKLIDYSQKIKNSPELFLEDTSKAFTKDFWDVRSNKCGETEEYSTPDVYLNRRENRLLKNFISKTKTKRILDLGCGNGWSRPHINPGENCEFYGIDFNESAINNARELAIKNKLKQFHFEVADMEKLRFDDNYFDLIYSKRSLSNLPSQRKQELVIAECARTLEKGGTLYIQDLFLEGYQNLNALRKKFGLEEIKYPRHAHLLEDRTLREMTQEHFDIVDAKDNTTPYYFISRVIYPSLKRITRGEVKSESLTNRLASFLPSIGNLEINKRYAFRKK